MTSEAEYPYTSGTGLEDHPSCIYSLEDTPPVVSLTGVHPSYASICPLLSSFYNWPPGYNTLPSNNYKAVMEHLATVAPLVHSLVHSLVPSP